MPVSAVNTVIPIVTSAASKLLTRSPQTMCHVPRTLAIFLKAGSVHPATVATSIPRSSTTEILQSRKLHASDVARMQDPSTGFWTPHPSRELLLQNIRRLAQRPEARVPSLPHGPGSADIIAAYRSLYSDTALTATELRSMTSTERLMFDDIGKALFPGKQLMPGMQLIQSAGRFDPDFVWQRRALAENLMKKLEQKVKPGTDPSRWNKSQQHDHMRATAACLQNELKIPGEIDVRFDNLSRKGKGVLASTSFTDENKATITFYPRFFHLGLLGQDTTCLHEFIHILQKHESMMEKADQEIRASRNAGPEASVQGPLISREMAASGRMAGVSFESSSWSPFAYPMQRELERDAWMTHVAAKIIGAHSPSFASKDAYASVYTDIGLAALKHHGPERIFTAFAERMFGLEMDKLAVACGFPRDTVSGNVSLHDALRPLSGLQQYVKEKLDASKCKPDALSMQQEIRAELLNECIDVVLAAENPGDVHTQEAQMALQAIHDAVGIANPLKNEAGASRNMGL